MNAPQAFGESMDPYWLADAGGPTRPAAAGETSHEVAVVGAGFTGLMTAYLLATEGVDVCVLEAGRISSGVSGHTTAKLSALQQVTYSDIESTHGEERSKAYARGNLNAVESVAGIIEAEGIECDLRRNEAVIFARTEDGFSDLAEESAAARRAGLDVQGDGTDPGLRWPALRSISLPNQLELHPRRFLDGLASAAERAGAVIYESSRVVSASKLPGDLELRTDDATVTCKRAVIATLMPILDRGVFFSRLTCKRSYSVAYRIDEPLGGMYISIEEPTESLRSHPDGEGEMLILGGAGHTLGDGTDPAECYAKLKEFAALHLGVAGEPVHYWSAHDLMPADGYPYAGQLTPFGEKILFASGFRKWGLTNGVWCARVLADEIVGRDNPDAELLKPNRLTPSTLSGVAEVGMTTSKHMARWAVPRLKSAEDLEPGEGGLTRAGAIPVGAYRTPSGELRKVVPACTHLGCPLQWNAADTSWDCPCHGSRFDTEGDVLQGPATRPLKRLT